MKPLATFMESTERGIRCSTSPQRTDQPSSYQRLSRTMLPKEARKLFKRERHPALGRRGCHGQRRLAQWVLVGASWRGRPWLPLRLHPELFWKRRKAIVRKMKKTRIVRRESCPLYGMTTVSQLHLNLNLKGDIHAEWRPSTSGDVTQCTWLRYEAYLRHKAISVEDVVQGVDGGRGGRAGRKRDLCALCNRDVWLDVSLPFSLVDPFRRNKKLKLSQDHTTYSLCPSPFRELRPVPLCSSSNISSRHTDQPTLSQLDFSFSKSTVPAASDPPAEERRPASYCLDVFHIDCLARCFLAQEQAAAFSSDPVPDKEEEIDQYVLPVGGCCPTCFPTASAEEGDWTRWNEVARSVFRRRERVQKEIVELEKRRMLEARLVRQRPKGVAGKRGAKAATKGVPTSADGMAGGEDEAMAEEHEQGLEAARSGRTGILGELDKVSIKAGLGVVPLEKPSLQNRNQSSGSAAPVTSSNAASTKKRNLLGDLDALLNSSDSAYSSSSSAAAKSTKWQQKETSTTFKGPPSSLSASSKTSSATVDKSAKKVRPVTNTTIIDLT